MIVRAQATCPPVSLSMECSFEEGKSDSSNSFRDHKDDNDLFGIDGNGVGITGGRTRTKRRKSLL